jgi:hypothetical protein
MIILRPMNLHWIDGSADDPADLCAHSGVNFQIDGDTLVRDGDWTVSAAVLYLLRTLSLPHTKAQPVGDHLFPYCGHSFFEVAGQDDVPITGCNSGIDFEVVEDRDTFLITAEDGRSHRVGILEWRAAVCGFSDTVQAFYVSSSPKVPADEFERQSFRKFLSEWARRRSDADSGPRG